ncbi:phosphocholine-specific phospholipase C [Actinocrispum wychmicini]|nr:phospholipase C, phosphocholine-specific [Actinocrispum wychmicini]
MSRRRFLAGSATTAAAMALPGQASADPAPTKEATIDQVEHVVLLMQENRSFDHYFGTLKGVRGYSDRTPVTLPNGKSVFYQPNPWGLGETLPFHLDTGTTRATCMDAPPMSYKADLKALNKGHYDGWIKDRVLWEIEPSRQGMGFFKRDDLPFYHALAEAFTICDNTFCSTLTRTNSNRLMFFTGTNGLSIDGHVVIENDDIPKSGLSWTTYAERLQKNDISWKVYQQEDNFDDNSLAWFTQFKDAEAGDPLHDNGMAKVDDLVDAFAEDVKNDTLPQVSWIVAPAHLSEHATNSPAKGEDLTARLLKALWASPDVWARTVFILNYDENGGFFDHVPPPLPNSDLVQGHSTVDVKGEVKDGKPIGLGFRVPQLIVSPWTAGGWVCSEVFDFTSVLRFLEKRFGVDEPNISAWRRAVCGDLTSAFDFSAPDTSVPDLPDTSKRPAEAKKQCSDNAAVSVPWKQTLPTQEPGRRDARTLPYAFEASAGHDPDSSKNILITMTNTGTAGVCLTVYATGYRTDGPWVYTIEAGKSWSDYWNVINDKNPNRKGGYQLDLHGPNGFLRQFRGDLSVENASGKAWPQVSGSARDGKYILALTNTGAAACVFTVRDTRDDTATRQEDTTYTVEAASAAEHEWNLDTDYNWYDLTVTVDSSPQFHHRYAGHVENGKPSKSG